MKQPPHMHATLPHVGGAGERMTYNVMFQGPIADALTHVGQLAIMRGVAGEPVRPESYARATIEPGRVGRDQAPPGREFDGDASRPAK